MVACRWRWTVSTLKKKKQAEAPGCRRPKCPVVQGRRGIKVYLDDQPSSPLEERNAVALLWSRFSAVHGQGPVGNRKGIHNLDLSLSRPVSKLNSDQQIVLLRFHRSLTTLNGATVSLLPDP